MSGLLLQAAGPLQSWGTHSRFADRDTATAPTRSGLIGMIAAALGRGRQEPFDDLHALRFIVRIDRPGVVTTDLHTVGGGLAPPHTVATAEGKRRSKDTSTVLSHRRYLADAAFTIAVTAPGEESKLIETCARALEQPIWPPYLGRRSCPPAGPLLLTRVDDPVIHLGTLPLSRPQPHKKQDNIDIDFLADIPLMAKDLGLPQGAAVDANDTLPATELDDDPVSFHPLNRRYRTRPIHRTTAKLPTSLCAGIGTSYVRTLTTYIKEVAR